jgi:Transposase
MQLATNRTPAATVTAGRARPLVIGSKTPVAALRQGDGIAARVSTFLACIQGESPSQGQRQATTAHHPSDRVNASRKNNSNPTPPYSLGGQATLAGFAGHALANMVVDQVRRRVQQTTLGHRGRKQDPLYRIRKLAITARERLTQRGRARLRAGLAAGDPTGEVVAAWQGKELLRAVYAAAGTEPARAALERFYRWADGVGVAELSRLARTVRAWEAEVLAFHSTQGCSNGSTEAVNLLIKKVKRVGHGFRNFDNYRLRLLLHCGVTWPIPQTARLRGRSPRKSLTTQVA